MNAINRVIELLNNVSGSLYNAYLETRGWIYPFSSVATFFYGLSSLFASVSWQVYYFGQWVNEITGKVGKILSFENIASHFRSFFEAASDALEWVSGAFKNVINIVDTWWDITKQVVWSRIDIAKQALQSNLDALGKRLGTLQGTISNIIATIPTKKEVLTWITSLIDTRTKELKPFWDGWQEMRDKVFELFHDPEKWLLNMIERTIARFL